MRAMSVVAQVLGPKAGEEFSSCGDPEVDDKEGIKRLLAMLQGGDGSRKRALHDFAGHQGNTVPVAEKATAIVLGLSGVVDSKPRTNGFLIVGARAAVLNGDEKGFPVEAKLVTDLADRLPTKEEKALLVGPVGRSGSKEPLERAGRQRDFLNTVMGRQPTDGTVGNVLRGADTLLNPVLLQDGVYEKALVIPEFQGLALRSVMELPKMIKQLAGFPQLQTKLREKGEIFAELLRGILSAGVTEIELPPTTTAAARVMQFKDIEKLIEELRPSRKKSLIGRLFGS